jgi:asparaginyl-tRNA synthetase
MQTYINQLSEHVGQEVTLKGWLYNLRSSGKLLFPQLRDGTGVVQCVVFKKAVAEEVWDALKGLGQESALIIRGTVRADERAPGGFEVDVSGAQVVHEAHDYPITPKEHGTEFLMDHRHLWLRSRRQHAILKVRHTVIKAIHDFLDADNFTLLDAPVFTPAACEGTTTLFEVDYFDDAKAYLTQSGQLYNEATVEDAPPPDGVLDGRARNVFRHARRRDGFVRAFPLVNRRARVDRPCRGAEDSGTRHGEARSDYAALPAPALRRGGQDIA